MIRRLALFLATVLVFPAAALDGFVEAEVWSEYDPIVFDGSARPLPQEVVLERLLDEAQYTISGLIYGYQFNYVPGDPARDVEESFELEPFATIPRGDPGLLVFQTWREDRRLYARVGYELSPDQMGWFEGWRSSANPRSYALGASSLFLGPESKSAAIGDGIKNAVREHVRAQVFNRPQRITGAAVLASAPQFVIDRGNYQAGVDIYLQIDEIQRSEAF